MKVKLALIISIIVLLLSCGGENTKLPEETKSTFLDDANYALLSNAAIFSPKSEASELSLVSTEGGKSLLIGDYVDSNTGYKVHKGSSKESKTGYTNTRLIVSYGNIKVKSNESKRITIDGKEATDVNIAQAENALKEAKEISSDLFKREGDSFVYNGNTRSLSNIQSVSLTLSSDSDRASSTYTVTLSDGRIIKEEREKIVTVEKDSTEEDISAELKDEFSFERIHNNLPSSIHVDSKGNYTLLLSTIHANSYPPTQADREFARLVEEKSNRRLKVIVYPGGTYISSLEDTLNALKNGDIAFSHIASVSLEETHKDLSLFQLPYLFRDDNHLKAFFSSSASDDLKNTVGDGLKALAFYDSGSRHYYFRDENTDLTNLNGLKIRVLDNEFLKKMIEAQGGTAVTASSSAVKDKLQNGELDGAVNNWSTYVPLGDYTAAPYIVIDGNTKGIEVLLASSTILSHLDPDLIQVIKESAKEAENKSFELLEKREAEDKEIYNAYIEDQNIGGIRTLTESEFTRLRYIMKDKVWTTYNNPSLIEEVLALEN